MQKQKDQDKIRIFNIRDRFALDLFRLLDAQLQADNLDEEALIVKTLALLSDTRKPYARQLLFQDYRQPSERVIAEQSHLYVTERLLLYRLKPAANLAGKPGNMLLLLQALFRKARAQWTQSAEIKRQAEIRPHSEDYFQTTAETLAHLCQQLEAELCKVSKGQREKYGILQLQAQQNCAEAPEEISFFQMLRVLPLPLTSLHSDPELSKLMVKVIDSLNERYMLLRACGLNPDHWLHREELSIGNLKNMVTLRNTAKRLSQLDGLEHDVNLYEKSFKQLQADKNKFAGCEHFTEFRHSEAGEIFLNAFAFVDPIAQQIIDEIADNEKEKNILFRLEMIEKLIEDYPEAFDKDPVMLHFFRESLAGGLPLCGDEGIDGVLDQAEFQALIANDKRYANLDQNKLAKKIYANAKKIINAGHRKCRFQIH